MLFQERSLGPLYAARVEVNEVDTPPHFVGIVETEPPWRKGRALVVQVWGLWAIVVGLWLPRSRRGVDPELADELWLAPKVLAYGTGEIANWSGGEDEEAAEAVTGV